MNHVHALITIFIKQYFYKTRLIFFIVRIYYLIDCREKLLTFNKKMCQFLKLKIALNFKNKIYLSSSLYIKKRFVIFLNKSSAKYLAIPSLSLQNFVVAIKLW